MSIHRRLGGGIHIPGRAEADGLVNWTFLLAIETGSAVPQTQFIGRAVDLPGDL